MTIKQRYLWDSETRKWLPEAEVRAKRARESEPAFNFHVYKAGYNFGLGGYCGSRGDEKSLINQIEDRTGDRPVAIGDATLSNEGTRKEYSVREAMRHING